ncbi:MAG: hypothetical protein J6A13_00275 [Paludibacteraceae bacterium]|nr:hypothetical protein [Paludibacteraceae bacterium]
MPNPRLLYRIGSDAGFFSEYNNMVLAMVYCQRNNICFLLSSKGANFAYDKGWDDYFLPFCRELNLYHQTMMNPRYEAPLPTTGKREKIKRCMFALQKKLWRIDLLTYDIFHDVRKQYVDDNLIDACREISNRIWQYNKQTQDAIKQRIRTLSLPDTYVSVHIRRGDKAREAAHTDIAKYISLLETNTSCRDVFVATDDYSVYEELCAKYPDWQFYTLTPAVNRGYDQRKFEAFSAGHRRDEMLTLFSDIELLAASSLFVGTLSSNIGMYLYWRMPQGRCLGVDYNDWRIW